MLNLWKTYIKRNTLWFSALCALMILMCLYLIVNDSPLVDVLYGVLLCLVVAGIFIGYDLVRYVRKHKELNEKKKCIQLGINSLPAAGDIIEEDYKELLETLYINNADEKNELQKRHQDMTEYYSMWVHQIKTPIAAMRLILNEDEAGKRDIEDELFRIEQYVEMVMQYLRLDSETTDYVFEEKPLDGMIREVIRKYAKVFIRKKLSMEYEGTEVKILTDEKWLVFVIEQLVSNAVKYTHNGGVRIYVEETRQKVKIAIEDTGIGIRSEDIPRVCEKGYTGYNGRADKHSTGIGLYLCKCILDKLSARLEINSQIGVGTCVKIVLNKR